MERFEGERTAGVVAALAAVWVIWGSTYLGIRIGLESFPPFAMQSIRFTVAGSALFGWLRWRGVPAPSRTEWWAATRVGVLLLIGGLGLVTLAERRGVATGLVATLIAVQPAMLSLSGGLWGRWPGRREWIGMGVGMIGVLVLTADSGFSASPIGFGLVLLASVSWSFGSALSRQLPMPPGAMASACEMLAAAGGYAVLAVVLGEHLHTPSARSVLALAYLAVFGSLIAFSAYLYLLQRVRPTVAVSYAYVNPVIAVILGAAVNHEHVGPALLIALPLILAGVALVMMTSSRGARASESGLLGDLGEELVVGAERLQPVDEQLETRRRAAFSGEA
jgi:drug/metabolite transporter (DMT)-like permease